MIMCWCALVLFSIFLGCGMKSLAGIASRMVDRVSIRNWRSFDACCRAGLFMTAG
jgi:hypothetical protein